MREREDCFIRPRELKKGWRRGRGEVEKRYGLVGQRGKGLGYFYLAD